MDKAEAIRKAKTALAAYLVLCISVFAVALLIDPFGYRKILIGLSIVILGMAVDPFLRLHSLTTDSPASALEYDERIVSARNNADAISLRVLRPALMIAFLGYTFARPEEIFESLGWWLIMVVNMIAVLLPAILLDNVNRRFRTNHEE